MERTYKYPPINEMYLSVHFQAKPPIGSLDLQQFTYEVEKDFQKPEYIFPIIERVGDMHKILDEPEKVCFQSQDETRLLQLIRNRMVYNWRTGEQSANYPKYETIKLNFFKYWCILSNYLKRYKNREVKPEMCELFYSNILPIGENEFLKNDTDLYKALNFISPYPKSYGTVTPKITLQIPISENILTLQLEKIKKATGAQKAFLLMFAMRPNKKVASIDENWYDEANKHIRQFFEEVATEDIKKFWRGDSK